MKIIKDGKRNCGAFKFKCNRCGCKFEANVNDYNFVKWSESDDDYVISNESTDAIQCECPNCSKMLYKNIYKKDSDSDLICVTSFISSLINIILSVVCVIMKETTGLLPPLFEFLLIMSNIITFILIMIFINDCY